MKDNSIQYNLVLPYGQSESEIVPRFQNHEQNMEEVRPKLVYITQGWRSSTEQLEEFCFRNQLNKYQIFGRYRPIHGLADRKAVQIFKALIKGQLLRNLFRNNDPSELIRPFSHSKNSRSHRQVIGMDHHTETWLVLLTLEASQNELVENIRSRAKILPKLLWAPRTGSV